MPKKWVEKKSKKNCKKMLKIGVFVEFLCFFDDFQHFLNLFSNFFNPFF